VNKDKIFFVTRSCPWRFCGQQRFSHHISQSASTSWNPKWFRPKSSM